MLIRHSEPATLTSTGRIATIWLPGEADSLTGYRRWREIWYRLRLVHGRRDALLLLLAAWRHGVTLSGPPVHRKGKS